MRRRPAQTPCLGERVSALADGSLRDDVRDRALAHTLTCVACRDALDIERLTIERMRALAAPRPSSRLVAGLLALGETGGPVPPRRGPGPGMTLPRPVALVPAGAPAAERVAVFVPPPPPPAGSVRPGGSTRPGTASGSRRRRHTFVVAAAGALGAGFVAAGLFTSAAGSPVSPSTRSPVAQFTLTPAQPAGLASSPQQFEPRPGGYTGSGIAPAGLSLAGSRDAFGSVGGSSGPGGRSDLAVLRAQHVPFQAVMAGALTSR